MSLDIYLKGEDGEVVFWTNITHNLGKMAKEAGIYDCLWRPDEHGMATAAQVAEPLATGLDLLERNQSRFKRFDAPNGWGKLSDFLPFCAEYLAACRQHPGARVEVSR